MSHEFESGFMVHQPSWHRLENAVLSESPRTWPEAREQAGLTWEVYTEPVYTAEPIPLSEIPELHMASGYRNVQPVEGWQAIRRDDTHDVLSIQPSSYKVIENSVFGGLIEIMLGIEGDEYVEFEALMSLYEGRQIVALVRLENPIKMPFDPSKNYVFLVFASRHDGQGGVRGIPTNIRVVCANTFNAAELTDGKAGFTIRHTTNWGERVEEIRTMLTSAREDSLAYAQFAEDLSRWSATKRQQETFLKRFLPISDDMTARAARNRELSRERIREILRSATCDHISDTGYGLLMAATEWSDHHREFRSTDSYVSRQLLGAEPTKTRAASILRQMADARR